MKIIVSTHKPFAGPARILANLFSLSGRKAQQLARNGGELALDPGTTEDAMLDLASSAENQGVRLDLVCV